MWAQVLPKIKVHEGAVVRSGGLFGWAIRKDSPKLREILTSSTSTPSRRGDPIYPDAAIPQAHQAAQGPNRLGGLQALRETRWRCSGSTARSTASTL